MDWIMYIIAGLGAGVITGLAGLSAALIITPLLVSVCGWESYDAATVALGADILASYLTAYTFRKNKNVNIHHGVIIGSTALVGTLIGSYSGFLFSQELPDGLGYISMITAIFVGLKFLVKPTNGGLKAEDIKEQELSKPKILFAMICSMGIGWVCGFTGSGGGILLLTLFTILLRYDLKVAVGTSTMIMTFVALVGTISHFTMGANVKMAPMALVVAACLVGAFYSSKFANNCDIKRLNRIIGYVLIILGIVTILMKLL